MTTEEITPSSGTCNRCGSTDGNHEHDCTMVLLSRARWLILHYAHTFAEADKKEALPLVEQIAGLLAAKRRMRCQSMVTSLTLHK